MREEETEFQAAGLAIILLVQGALWLTIGLGIGRLLWGPV